MPSGGLLAASTKKHLIWEERPVPVLSLRKISKSFGAIKALTEVDLDLDPGEVLGLMGDNGAGKSTLVKIIAGNFPPTSGDIVLQDKPIHFHKPVEAREAGIEIVYQDLALCDNLTATANIFLSREIAWRFGPFKMLSSKAMSDRAGELFGELKSETRPHDLVRRMSGGQRQAVAISRTRAVRSQDRADGRADGRDLACARWPRSSTSSGGCKDQGDRYRPDQPSHARRVRGVPTALPCCAADGKVAEKPVSHSSPEEVTGLITGAIHAA